MLICYLTINLFYGTGNLLIDAIKWSQETQKYIAEKIFDFLWKQARKKL